MEPDIAALTVGFEDTLQSLAAVHVEVTEFLVHDLGVMDRQADWQPAVPAAAARSLYWVGTFAGLLAESGDLVPVSPSTPADPTGATNWPANRSATTVHEVTAADILRSVRLLSSTEYELCRGWNRLMRSLLEHHEEGRNLAALTMGGRIYDVTRALGAVFVTFAHLTLQSLGKIAVLEPIAVTERLSNVSDVARAAAHAVTVAQRNLQVLDSTFRSFG